jgi:hypothetical protein
MKTLCLLIQVCVLLISTTLWAEPVTCKKVGQKKIAIQNGQTLTISDELAISRIDTVVSCETKRLDGFDFLIARYTATTSGGTDGRGVTRLIHEVFLLGDVNRSLNYNDLNETSDKNGRFNSPPGRCELIALPSDIGVVCFSPGALEEYFDAVHAKDEAAQESALNGFSVETFTPGKKPCGKDDYSCQPHFAFDFDKKLIRQLVENIPR